MSNILDTLNLVKESIDNTRIGCKYCSSNGKPLEHIQDTHALYKNVGNGDKPPYLIVELKTGGNIEAHIYIESASESKVNRGAFGIRYCPMCGRRL